MPKPVKKVVEETSSEEEEVVVTKQQKNNAGAAKKAQPKKVVESDSSEEEEIIKPAKTGKIAQKVAAKAPAKKAVETSDESSEEEAPKKAAAKPAAKAAAKKVVEESDDSDDEPAPPKKAAAKPAAKPAAKKVVESDDESSEEEAPKKAAAKPAAKAAAKKVVEESDDESDESTPKAAPKKAAPKKVVEEEEEDEEEEEAAPVKNVAKAAPVQAVAAVGDGKGLNHPNEVIVKGLPFAASEHDLTEYFQECGTVDGVNLLKGPDGRSKGIAFVRFTTEDGLKAAVAFSGSDFGGRSVTIEKTTPREQRAPAAGNARDFGQKSERDPTSASIFVGNLSYQTTEDSLWAFFETCGQIANVRVAKDQEGNPRGFAHVDFASPDAVEAAVQKAGSKLDGRPIRVDYSTPKKNDGQRGGFGGGNRFGGDRQGGFGGDRQGGFGGGFKRGPPGGGRMQLGEEDAAKKKGSISSFQGSKQRL